MTAIDPFLTLRRPEARLAFASVPGTTLPLVGIPGNHSERKHSKFAASAAERWFNCPGSVELSEGLPDKSSSYADEGTRAHEVLESLMRIALDQPTEPEILERVPREMVSYGVHAAEFILNLHHRTARSEILVETRIYLDFVHPDAFGTFDGAVVDHFGTLHVFDYKYGKGVFVSPDENLQMIFYGMGLAHRYDWNFKKVRLWIIQPRVKGYEGPLYWECGIEKLESYVPIFREKVERVITEKDVFVEGSWCHWCRAKTVCPLKRKAKLDKARETFGDFP